MKILTKKQLESIEKNSYEKGKNDGVKMIVDFLNGLKNLNVYASPVYFNSKEMPKIKNSVFLGNEYGVYVTQKKFKKKKK